MKTKYTQRQVITALKQTKGMVYLAAKRLGCDSKTINNYRTRFPQVEGVIMEERGELVDMAEVRLLQALNRGDPWAVRFFLITQGKHRGYVERQEVSGTDGSPIQIQAHDTGQADAVRELIIALRAAVERCRNRARLATDS
jgi:hypothetical protein